MAFIYLLSILYKLGKSVLRPRSCVNPPAGCVSFQTFCVQLEVHSERLSSELDITDQADQRITGFGINHCLWSWIPNYFLTLHHP